MTTRKVTAAKLEAVREANRHAGYRTSKSRAAHTPGPWTVQKEGRVSAGRVEICQHISGLGIPQTEYQANAHLIAAAPELLTSLSSTLAALENWVEIQDAQDARQYDVDAISAARAAIAKATGGAP